MTHLITLIPGDGIGPEIVEVAKRVVASTGVDIEWEEMAAGVGVMAKHGTPLPDEVLESIKRNKVALKGPITTPVGKGIRSVNVALRKELDLYVCLRPCKSYIGVRSAYCDVDLVIIRENTEGLYAGIEFEIGTSSTKQLVNLVYENVGTFIRTDSAISLKPVSQYASERIIRFAFDYARKFGRKKVTVVHKANIMKATDGLFLNVARNLAEGYLDIRFEDKIVDNMCMQLVQNPQEYDVIVCGNMFGDIISDLAAGLVGGLGVTPGANLGEDVAVFEPTHGSAPKYKGMNVVNPIAMLLSAVLMLRHIAEEDAATLIERAIADIIREGKMITYDMKQNRSDPTAVTTTQVGDAIMRRMEILAS